MNEIKSWWKNHTKYREDRATIVLVIIVAIPLLAFVVLIWPLIVALAVALLLFSPVIYWIYKGKRY